MKRSSPCRLRPMACECGYRTYGTRSWWELGFPTCPCGGTITPTKPADLAWCGLISQEDMPAPMWTAICRENGWEDAIQRKGAAAKSYNARVLAGGGVLGRRAGAGHCVYPGCGRWISEGADVCSAGHVQHENIDTAAAMPF